MTSTLRKVLIVGAAFAALSVVACKPAANTADSANTAASDANMAAADANAAVAASNEAASSANSAANDAAATAPADANAMK